MFSIFNTEHNLLERQYKMKTILFESSRLAKLSGINEATNEADAFADARARLTTADREAVLAARDIIKQLLASVELKPGDDTLDGSDASLRDEWRPTQVVLAALKTAGDGKWFLPLAGLRNYAAGNYMWDDTESAFRTIADFKDSKSQPGQGDKDATAYSNLMAAALDMGDLANKWGAKVPAFAVAKSAKALKDAVFAAYNALARSKPGPAVGSPEALKTADF
jgi:hypothetical protein